MDIKEDEILGDRVSDHWYYRAKGRVLLRAIGPVIRQTLVDVGAGSGVFSKLLLEEGRAKAAYCVDPGYARDKDEKVAGRPLHFRREWSGDKADLVLMMDVLEHVDDDFALLTEYSDPLRPGAEVFVTVPAFQSLWSGHDVFLEHRKRYRREEVDALMARAGLKVKVSRYFYGGLFPVAYVKRRGDRKRLEQGAIQAKSDLSMAPPLLNAALTAAHDVERWLVYPWNKVMGLSVVCLAEKV
ncbi:MAG: class I SAM-dependent methyltransferase [Pseudomonadota bacterium]